MQPSPQLAQHARVRERVRLAKRQHPEVEGTNPLALWDMHYLRQIDDSGFIDKRYG